MKKKSILSLLFVIFPILVVVGMSTWIIIYEVTFSPTYVASSISEFFGVSQETIYNGEEQVPVQKMGDPIPVENILYKYKLESEEEDQYISGKPIDAGIYDVIIEVQDVGECKVKFTIKPKEIKLLEQQIVQMDYDSNLRTFNQIIYSFVESLKFIDNNNNEVATKLLNCKIVGMHNGVYYYGEVPNSSNLETTDTLVGSTYLAYLSVGNPNYEVTNTLTCIIKYKTAMVDGVYYTIEDALLQTGTITFAGDATDSNSYVMTSFTSLTKSEGNPYTNFTEENGFKSFVLKSGMTLHIPYDDTTNDLNEIKSTAPSSFNVYSCFIIPKDIIIRAETNAKINIGGVISGYGYVGDHGVIMNYGNIYMQSQSTLNSYGFLKGTGLLTLESGSVTQDCMRIFDWASTSSAMDVKNAGAFPIVSWSMHNISCPTKIYNGANYKAYASIYGSNFLVGLRTVIIDVIGDSSSSSNCLFRPMTSSKSSDYIYKYGTSNNNSCNLSITESNQIKGQKDIIEIHGNYEDVKLSVGISGYSFETSTTCPAPLSYMDIIVATGGTLKISNSSYVFLLGTSLTVEKNAILDISGGAYMAFDKIIGSTIQICPFFKSHCTNLVDAEFILNGTLSGTGSIGGIIQTEKSGAQLTISSYIIDSIKIKSASNAATEITNYAAYGSIGDTVSFNENEPFENNTAYVSITSNNSEYYFTIASNVKQFIIHYYDEENQIESQTIQVLTPDSSGNYIYEIVGDEYIPEKRHYDFSQWLLSDNTPAIGYVLKDGENDNTLNLYASWSEHTYSFYYTGGYKDNDNNIVNVTDDMILSNAIDQFTLSDFIDGILSITTTSTYNGKYFNGWYIGIDASTNIEISSISIDHLNMYIDNFGDDTSIFLYCEFTDLEQFKVSFITNNDQHEGFDSINVSSGNTIDLTPYNDDLRKFDLISTYDRFFTGWYTSEDIEFTSDSIVSSNLVLYAKWEMKEELSIRDSNGTEIDLIYYIVGQYVALPSEISKEEEAADGYIIKYDFDKWQIHGGYLDGQQFNANESIIIEEKFDGIIYIEPIYSESNWCRITVTVSNATITITIIYNGETITCESDKTIDVILGTDIKIDSITYTQDNNQEATLNGVAISVGATYTIENNSTLNVESSSSCLVEGTLITMADGSKKPVEQIIAGDMVQVFNHETGKVEVSRVIFNDHSLQEAQIYKIINCEFSNGSIIKIVYEHGFFNKEENKYVYLTNDNYKKYIGKTFITFDEDGNKEEIILLNAYLTEEQCRIYSPVTEKTLNYFTEGILSMPGGIFGLFNIFEYDIVTLEYDQIQKQSDINQYGLLTVNDFNGMINEYMFDIFNGKYLNVAIGKGLITWEYIKYLAERYGSLC